MKRAMFLALAFSSLWFVGCSEVEENSGNKAQADSTEIVMGRYFFGHEVRSLRPCGEDRDLWVVDSSGLLEELHRGLVEGMEPNPGIFVLLKGKLGEAPTDGFGADYDGQVTVDDVLYAALEGAGCGFPWDGFRFRAMGQEPFWMVEVVGGELRTTPFGQEELVWAAVEETSKDGVLTFRASDPEQGSIELILTPGGGSDSMSGAYGGYTASLRLGEESFRGYAVQGHEN